MKGRQLKDKTLRFANTSEKRDVSYPPNVKKMFEAAALFFWMFLSNHGNPRYILDLLLSVITVSMKTMEIVESLPRFEC